MSSNSKLLFTLLSGLLCLGFLSASAYLTYQTASLMVSGVGVRAEVIDLKYKRGRQRTQGVYRPVFRYEYNGKDYVRQSEIGSNPPKYEKEDRVRLIVDPSQPRKFLAPDWSSRWRRPFVSFCLFFLALLIFSVIKTTKVTDKK